MPAEKPYVEPMPAEVTMEFPYKHSTGETIGRFLAGLKARGVAVLVHERVRQVGPGKEGAKGSYTTYRIAEAG